MSLFEACQAGLVNNLNDGMSWGLFPLFFAAHGLPVEQIGVVKAVYPLTWGLLQVATGPLSDRIGRRSLIPGGMVVQAVGIWLTVLEPEYGAWLIGAVLQGRHGHGLCDAPRRHRRSRASLVAGVESRRLSVLA